MALKCRRGTHEFERDESKYFYYLKEASAADLDSQTHKEFGPSLRQAEQREHESSLHHHTCSEQGRCQSVWYVGGIFFEC